MIELKTRISKKIQEVKDLSVETVLSGNLDQEKYQKECGFLSGLEEALEIFNLEFNKLYEEEE